MQPPRRIIRAATARLSFLTATKSLPRTGTQLLLRLLPAFYLIVMDLMVIFMRLLEHGHVLGARRTGSASVHAWLAFLGTRSFTNFFRATNIWANTSN